VKTVSTAKDTLQVDLHKYNKEAEELNSRCQELLRVIDANEQKHQLEVETMQSKLKLLQSRLEGTEVQLKSTRSEAQRLQVRSLGTLFSLSVLAKLLVLPVYRRPTSRRARTIA